MSSLAYHPDRPDIRKAARAVPGSISDLDKEGKPTGTVLIDDRHGNALVKSEDGRWITIDVWSSAIFHRGLEAARKSRRADLLQKGVSAAAGALIGLFLLLIRNEPDVVLTLLLGAAAFTGAVLTVLAIVRNLRLLKLSNGASEAAFLRVVEVRDPASFDAGPWRTSLFAMPPLEEPRVAARPLATDYAGGQQPGYERLSIVALVLTVFFTPAAVVVGILALGRTRRKGTRGRGIAIATIAYGSCATLIAASLAVISLTNSQSPEEPSAAPAATAPPVERIDAMNPKSTEVSTHSVQCGVAPIAGSPAAVGRWCRADTVITVGDDGPVLFGLGSIALFSGDTSYGAAGYSVDVAANGAAVSAPVDDEDRVLVRQGRVASTHVYFDIPEGVNLDRLVALADVPRSAITVALPPGDVVQAGQTTAPTLPVDTAAEESVLAAQREDVRAIVSALDIAYPLTGAFPLTGQVDDSYLPLHEGNHVVNFTSNGSAYSFKVTSENSATDLLFKSAVGGQIYEVPE